MLNRLYIDNWRCFVNFEMLFTSVQCLAGSNGVGKTSVLTMLRLLQDFVTRGGDAEKLFATSSLTRWQSREEQQFEIDVNGDGGMYRYTIVIEHNRIDQVCRIKEESLKFDDQYLFEFRLGKVQLYRDNFSQGPTFNFDWTLSGLGAIGAGQDNQRLDWFRRWLDQLQIIQINPFEMDSVSANEAPRLSFDATNFASWFRHLSLDQPDVAEKLREHLRLVWPKFRSLRLEKAGPQVRELKARIADADGHEYDCAAGELSEGQRCLLILYGILSYAELSEFSVIGLDEPLNFVTLSEIQPWLGQLIDLTDNPKRQVILSGHHPGLLNYLAPDQIRVLYRKENGPTRVGELSTDDDAGLTAAELLTRGGDQPDA